jgi:hypothetical protein
VRCGCGEHRETPKARDALVGSTDGGEGVGLPEAPVWLKGFCLDCASFDDGQERSLGHLALAEFQPGVGLGELERFSRRGEQDFARSFRDPERPSDSSREKEDVRNPLVDPGGRHRPVQLLEGKCAVPLGLHESEDDLRIDGHVRLGTLKAALGEEFLVVLDDAVVDPDDRAMANGMVVGRE